MRFKQWLIQIEGMGGGGAATSMMHGGISGLPGSALNTNMPVQSKISTKDGCDKMQPDGADDKIDPDKLFNFRSHGDKKAAAERRSQWIDMNRRRTGRFVTVPGHHLLGV